MNTTFKDIRLWSMQLNGEGNKDKFLKIRDPLKFVNSDDTSLSLQGFNMKFVGADILNITTDDLKCGILRPNEDDNLIVAGNSKGSDVEVNVYGKVSSKSTVSDSLICDKISGKSKESVVIPEVQSSLMDVDVCNVKNITSNLENINFSKPIKSDSALISSISSSNIKVDNISSEKGTVFIPKFSSDDAVINIISSKNSTCNELNSETINTDTIKNKDNQKPVNILKLKSSDIQSENLNASESVLSHITSKSLKVSEITSNSDKEVVTIGHIASENITSTNLNVIKGKFDTLNIPDITISDKGITTEKNLKLNNKNVTTEEDVESKYRKLFLYEQSFKASAKVPARISLDSVNFHEKQKHFEVFIVSDDENFLGSARFIINSNNKIFKVSDSQVGSFQYELSLENNNDIIIKPQAIFNASKIPVDQESEIDYFKKLGNDTKNESCKKIASNTVSRLSRFKKANIFETSTFNESDEVIDKKKALEKEKAELEEKLKNTKDPLEIKEIKKRLREIEREIELIDNDNGNEDGDIDENKTFSIYVLIN